MFQGDREIRFFWWVEGGGGRIQNDYRKMSTDGRNVNVFGVVPQFGVTYLAIGSVHVLTVRCVARQTFRPTRKANTPSKRNFTLRAKLTTCFGY